MNIRRISRIACIVFLAVGLLMTVAMLVFAIGMEGMRHSRPGPSEFDSYYWSVVIPVILWGYWLASVFIRPSKGIIVAAHVITCVLAVAWIVILFEEGADIAAVATALTAVSFLAARWARISRDEPQTA
jgi:hypothetical protein